MYSIQIVDAGSNKLNVVKEVKAISNLGLKESKDIVDTYDSFDVPEDVDQEAAVAQLQLAGATVELTRK